MYHFPEIKQDRDLWLSFVGRDDIKAAYQKFEEKEFELKDGKLKKKIKKKPQYFVCRKHWPAEMKTFKCRGKDKPIDPPSIRPPTIASSTVPSSAPVQPAQILLGESSRPTKRALTSIRSVSPDELGTFLENDRLDFDEIVKKTSSNELVAFDIDEDTIGVQPRVFSPVPEFFIKIKRNLSFETFHH